MPFVVVDTTSTPAGGGASCHQQQPQQLMPLQHQQDQQHQLLLPSPFAHPTGDATRVLRRIQLPAPAVTGERASFHSKRPHSGLVAGTQAPAGAAAAATSCDELQDGQVLLPPSVLATLNVLNVDESPPQLLQPSQIFHMPSQSGCRQLIGGFTQVLSHALSNAAAFASEECQVGTNGTTDGGGSLSDSKVSQLPTVYISRSSSLTTSHNFQQTTSSTGTVLHGTRWPQEPGTCAPSQFPGAHYTTSGLEFDNYDVVLNCSHTSKSVHDHAQPQLPCSKSSGLAKQSRLGVAMLVPTEPANIFEASIAARPNFEARELPPSSYWYQVVNGLILCVLLAGSVIELGTGREL